MNKVSVLTLAALCGFFLTGCDYFNRHEQKPPEKATAAVRGQVGPTAKQFADAVAEIKTLEKLEQVAKKRLTLAIEQRDRIWSENTDLKAGLQSVTADLSACLKRPPKVRIEYRSVVAANCAPRFDAATYARARK